LKGRTAVLAHVEFLDGRQQIIELGCVQEPSLGVPIDDHAAEAQLGDRPVGFHDGGIRVLGGRRRQCVEPGGVRRNNFGAAVVDRPTEVGGVLGRDLLGSRRRDRQDLHVDARVVHHPQPLLADFHQLRGERVGRRRVCLTSLMRSAGSRCSSRAISVVAILSSFGG